MERKAHQFSKSRRLLVAADFANVFSNPPVKASHRHCLILAKPNQIGHSRIGLIVAKKNVRLAVQRNRVKRLIRECFRQHNISGIPVDMVILARRGIGELNNAEITHILDQQWRRVQKKLSSNQ